MQHKVLFVDDEANIRLTLPQILKLKGFDVVATGSVGEAIAAIQRERFSVLIADLNIGQPGAGFTVVSAMRRIQPKAVTLILTGYPAFESALEAIRGQVDDYLVKPADVEHLVDVIERNLESHTPAAHITAQKLWIVLRDHKLEIIQRWEEELKKQGILVGKIGTEEFEQRVEEVIEELAAMLEEHPSRLSPLGRKAAERHGRHMRDSNVALGECIEAMRMLRHVVYRVIQENLLAVNTSYVITDMISISDNLDEQLRAVVEAYEEQQAA